MSERTEPHDLERLLDELESASDGTGPVAVDEFVKAIGQRSFGPFLLVPGPDRPDSLGRHPRPADHPGAGGHPGRGSAAVGHAAVLAATFHPSAQRRAPATEIRSVFSSIAGAVPTVTTRPSSGGSSRGSRSRAQPAEPRGAHHATILRRAAHKDRHKAALSWATKPLERRPHDPDLLFRFAISLAHLDDAAGARRALEQAERSRPGS